MLRRWVNERQGGRQETVYSCMRNLTQFELRDEDLAQTILTRSEIFHRDKGFSWHR